MLPARRRSREAVCAAGQQLQQYRGRRFAFPRPGDELWYGQIDRAEEHEGQYRETDLYGLIIWRIHEHTVEWRDGKPAVIPDEDVAGTWARLDAIRVGADDW